MNRNTKYVCLNCRQFVTGDPCTVCKQPTTAVNHRWRIPKKNNHAAWRIIHDGDIMWDHKAIDKKNNRRPWLMRYDLDGTHRCPVGHKLVQPNVAPRLLYVICAACNKARIDKNNPNVDWRELADKYYAEMGIK
jgi:hypothetical protein